MAEQLKSIPYETSYDKTLRNAWLAELKKDPRFSERDLSLLRRASDVLADNTIEKPHMPWGACRGIRPSPSTYFGVWNWDSAFHAVALSRYDPKLAYEQFRIFFECQTADGMFPDVIFEDGKRMDNYSKPPVFPWAFVEVYRRSPDADMLKLAYDRYVFNESFWSTKRLDQKSGLYFYDATHVDDDWLTHIKWESGMDDSPRWDEKINEYLPVDLNAYMVTFYRALAFMAKELGKADDAARWEKREKEVADKVNALLWSEELRCYVDTDRFTGEQSKVLTPCCFAPLFAGFAEKEKAGEMAKHAADRTLFYPAMPSVSYSDPAFEADQFWRGPVWLNIAAFAIWGLENYGYFETAAAIRETLLTWADLNKKDIYETYNSVTGEGCGALHFGWSSAFLIELIMREKERKN